MSVFLIWLSRKEVDEEIKKKSIIYGLFFAALIFIVLLGYMLFPIGKGILFCSKMKDVSTSCIYEIRYTITGEIQLENKDITRLLNVIDHASEGIIVGEKQNDIIKFEFCTLDNIPILDGYIDENNIVIDVCSLYQYIRNNLSINGVSLEFLPDKRGEYYIAYDDLFDDELTDKGIDERQRDDGYKMFLGMARSNAPESKCFAGELESLYFLEGDLGDASIIIGIPDKSESDAVSCYVKLMEDAGEIEIYLQCNKDNEIQLDMPESSLSEIQKQIIKRLWGLVMAEYDKESKRNSCLFINNEL